MPAGASAGCEKAVGRGLHWPAVWEVVRRPTSLASPTRQHWQGHKGLARPSTCHGAVRGMNYRPVAPLETTETAIRTDLPALEA